MKEITKIVYVFALFFVLTACGTESSPDDDENTDPFEVPFEMYVPATQQDNGTWIVANGRFMATFGARGDANQYELKVVREDGSKGEPFIYTFQQLLGHRPFGSDLIYSVAIGSSFTYSGVNDSEKDQLVEEIQQELNENKHLYHHLEVTPL